MAINRFLFNGTDGADITTTNSGASLVAGPAANLNTAKFSAADAREGTSGIKFVMVTGGSATGSLARFALAVSNTQAAASFWMKTPATKPSAYYNILEIRHGSGRLGGLAWGSTFVFSSQTNTYHQIDNTGLMAVSTWYRIEIGYTSGATGSVTVKVYSTTGALVVTGSFASVASLANPVTHFTLGFIGNSGTAGEVAYDTLQIRDGSTTEIGAYSPPPTLALTTATGTLIDVRGSSGGSGALTYTISPITDVTTVEPGLWVAKKAGPYTYTVSDQAGGTVSDIIVVADATGARVETRRRTNGTW